MLVQKAPSGCTVTFEMPENIKELKPIPENPPRWKPTADPATITVAGVDTTASVSDQIDQIDQLITLKLQVRVFLMVSNAQHPTYVIAPTGH